MVPKEMTTNYTHSSERVRLSHKSSSAIKAASTNCKIKIPVLITITVLLKQYDNNKSTTITVLITIIMWSTTLVDVNSGLYFQNM